MQAAEIIARLQARFPGVIGELVPAVAEPWATVDAAALPEVCAFLRDDAGLRFDCLTSQTAVDRPADGKIEVVYHLFSYPYRHHLVLKVDTPRAAPSVPTVEAVWPAANWLERETFDLFGVDFPGHSDLRRIMLPEDWVGHPLRKDYVEPEHYHGIATRRESLLR
jgi:NADH-quinone oxidoreductase subunit C